MFHCILSNGVYATGDFLPEDAVEVLPQPRHEAEWESDTWTFPANLAMSDLRQERNQLLSATDWWANTDLTMTSAQTTYRQALRDLPSTASPELDSEGILTNVTWPDKP